MSFILSKPSSVTQQLKKIQAKVIDEKKSFIMFVHAEWCGYCRMMKPEWNKFVKHAKHEAKEEEKEEEKEKEEKGDEKKRKKLWSNVALIEIKDEVVSEIMKEKGEEKEKEKKKEKEGSMLKTIIQNTVSGYPTIVLAIQNPIKNTVQVVMFEGERTAEGLGEFLKQHKSEIQKRKSSNIRKKA